MQARLNKFSGAKAISSADYFERDEGANDVRCDPCCNPPFLRMCSARLATMEVGEIASSLVEGSKKLMQAASSYVAEFNG